MSDLNSESEVIVDTRDGVGRLVLNRPKAINALNHGMVGQIAAALAAWSDDDRVRAVVLTGAGERGLCAGGDIVSIYHDAQEGGTGSREFWR
ncbi:enoyl-CoA hydratase/isomerase family protein, partial [Rhodococcus sp. NPDC019616]|uniref:enoyl-CoA hydratase/isomerase family protein n=1 Tax=Rhodococcus sp. NPDC019616 TaxID=3154691 RepID=UPI0033DC8423